MSKRVSDRRRGGAEQSVFAYMAWKRLNPYPSSPTSPASTTREWSAPESAKLGDIIAVIAGADSRGDIESFGSAEIGVVRDLP